METKRVVTRATVLGVTDKLPLSLMVRKRAVSAGGAVRHITLLFPMLDPDLCPNDVHDGAFVSYAENRNLVKQSLENVPTPAATIALYEFTTLNCDPATAETVSATSLSAPQDSRRHDGGGPETAFGLNFLAADGHVKFLTPEQVSGGPNAVHAKGLPSGKVVETFAIK